jgi:hypothetical protein
MGLVLAFSGAIGTSRSEVSQLVANRLGWPRVKFADYIRDLARESGENPQDRMVLQKLGQALVIDDVDGFVEKVLARADWQENGNLIVDGLRHAEVRHSLAQKVAPNTLRVVHITLDEDTRQDRATRDKGIEQRLLARFDQDLTEAQIPKILPAYADLILDGTLPRQILAEKVIMRFVPSNDRGVAAAG